ncbi:MAB_1171c family putative transporter [Nocardia ninae]|uniref:DUF6545 domain-containing protein n=1 Tax=Nocardia ninae NBRC 108245 TaxID=1210091 RepID=A0A511M9C1_9NOCA|nr:MAB_1171c family putative transporter [Nocardia ninae]GEM37242.1 hypothetical protein NN4_17610 [Nocardia ninae NBRC 108245]
MTLPAPVTAPAPTPVIIAAIALLCAVTLARWLVIEPTPASRRVNRAISWISIGSVVHQCLDAIGYEELAIHLYLCCTVLAIADLYGLAKLFADADPARARERQRIYDAAAVVAGIATALVGRTEGTDTGFWLRAIVSLAVFNVPLLVSGVHIIRACLRDLRVENSLLKRIPYIGLLMLTTGWFFGSGLAVLRAFDGKPPGYISTEWSPVSCLFCVLLALVTGVPLVHAILARTGWDRTGRQLRRLEPLWRDLTTAVPEVVLPAGPGPREPESRLYRTTVEIRDALLHLKQHLSIDEVPGTSGETYAMQIARAARARMDGIAPTGARPSRFPQISARDMRSELAHLLDLARQWPRARAAISDPAPASRR